MHLSPKRKKPRKDELSKLKEMTVKADKDENDFEITPPPSPTDDEIIMMRVNQMRSSNTEKPAIKGVRRKLAMKDAVSKVVLTRQPSGAFITVTGCDGRRVYLRKTLDKPEKSSLVIQRKTHLLSCPVSELRRQAELERQKRLMSIVDERTSTDV
ncbi:uncharacterized protein LOC117116217, partial [Anneissia japonica]|uniref:uncharacterized protein LOC117116217 n=1 Tax=Anneissia japonica TaxID=1529436 RepID=UPI0014258F71